MTTIRQVAHKAGVSIGTVSRVLNNKAGVGEKTRQRVLGIASELGYNTSARPDAITMMHFGLLYHPMHGGLANPFYQNVFLGVEQACQARQINLSFNTLDMADVASRHLQSLPPLLNQENLTGLILVGALPCEIVRALTIPTDLPAVLVDNELADARWDCVMMDNVRGVATLTEYLIAHGHRRISLIGGPNRPSIRDRQFGYETVLDKYGLLPLIIDTPDLMPPGAETAVTQILDQAPETTAIICTNDLQAVAAIKKLQALGYQVPKDMSVTGFDDINMAQFTTPALTTVHVDRIALGQISAEMLLGRIRHPARPISKMTMGVRMIERASVDKVRS